MLQGSLTSHASLPLLIVFSWTSHLSCLICEMDRQHVKCLAQWLLYKDYCCYCQVALLLMDHFLWLCLLQYEWVNCNWKFTALRLWASWWKDPFLISFYQFFLWKKKKKRMFNIFSLSSSVFLFSFFLGDGWSYYFKKNVTYMWHKITQCSWKCPKVFLAFLIDLFTL